MGQAIDPESEIFRLHALAMAGAGALRTGQQWEAWLHRAERFASFGFVNTMLIWAQCPDALLLHDYAGWKRLDRQVIRSERGIRIIWRGQVTTVFDLLQTTGKPQAVRMNVPAHRGKPSADRWRALAALGFGEVRGDTGEIETARAAARGLLGCAQADEGSLTRRVEIDSVAFLIARRIGLDTSGITFPQATSWAGDDPRSPGGGIVAACAARILAAAELAFTRMEPSGAIPVRLVAGPRLAAKDSPRPVVADSGGETGRVLKEASLFFVRQLAGSPAAGYLARRGFGEAVQRQFGAGYAPAQWTALTDHLRELGFSEPAMLGSGLVKRSSRGTLFDVFRDRAMFPVRSADGTVAGFIGRASPDAGAEVPKYLNTRETELYRKGSLLFGLHEGASALAAGACPVIVEGPLDAIAVTAGTGGRYAGVASCGTALTTEQITLLRGTADLGKTGVRVAFDADAAGVRAAVRAYDLLHDQGVRAVAASLPEGQDPAGLLAVRGADALLSALDSAIRPLADVAIDAVIGKFEHWLEFDEGKFNALHAVAPMIARLPADEVAGQVARVAGVLGLTHAEVTGAITDAAASVAGEQDGVRQSQFGAGLSVRGPDSQAARSPRTATADPRPLRRAG